MATLQQISLLIFNTIQFPWRPVRLLLPHSPRNNVIHTIVDKYVVATNFGATMAS